MKDWFRAKSGGKTILNAKRTAIVAGGTILILAAAIAVFSPRVDRTIYKVTSTARSDFREQPQAPSVSSAVTKLFVAGTRAKEVAKQHDAEERRRRVSVRYRAPQIVGDDDSGPKAIRAGSKLIGFLVNPIDTRAQSLVRVRLPRGGEHSGVEIEPGSILIGQFNYSGEDDRVYVSFSRLDSPEGRVKKINAVALDAGNFMPGINGEEFTGGGTKIAASMGLSMFSGMADTLTDRESLGNSFNGVQAKPTMKNALLQGLSRTTQDQANRTANAIEQTRNYVIVPEGKEMIIELQEDFGK